MNILKRWLLVSALFFVGLAQAADPLLISGGTDRAIPIAVVPFAWQGGTMLPEDIAQVIGNDLRNSGTFQPIARNHMISQPAMPSEVIFRDWSAVGAQYLLVGDIQPEAGRLKINYAVLSVSSEQVMLSGSVTGTVEQLRDLAHYIADQAYEKLTGVKARFPPVCCMSLRSVFQRATPVTLCSVRTMMVPGQSLCCSLASRFCHRPLLLMASTLPMCRLNRNVRVFLCRIWHWAARTSDQL